LPGPMPGPMGGGALFYVRGTPVHVFYDAPSFTQTDLTGVPRSS